jgi:hypothetical protein
MSSLGVVADELGLSVRTIQRRCEVGQVPGAYREKKRGHWKINLELWHNIRRFQKDPMFLWAMTKGRDAFFFTLTARGISDDDINDMESLRECDPEKYNYYTQQPYRMHPDAYEALETRTTRSKHSLGVLMMKGARLRLNGKEATIENLANELGVSIPTLYRWYWPEEIRRARGVDDVEVRGQRGRQIKTKPPNESKKRRFKKRFSQVDDD